MKSQTNLPVKICHLKVYTHDSFFPIIPHTPWWSNAGEEDLMENTIACLDSDVVSVTYLHHFAREVLGLASIIRSSWRSVALPQSQLVLFGFPGNVLVRREKD